MKPAVILAYAALLIPCLLIQPVQAAPGITAEEAAIVAQEAFVYGFAPILLETGRQTRMRSLGGANRMVYFPLPDRTGESGPTEAGPSVISFTAYVDLAKEPVVFCCPDGPGRMVFFEVIDAYTHALPAPGTSGLRTALTGPGWKGSLPQGVTGMRSPTSGAWIFGRILYQGPRDKDALKTFMGRCSLTTLSRFSIGKRDAPHEAAADVPMPMSPLRQVLLMDMQAFFGRLALFMKRTPPPAGDAALLGRMTRIGIDARTGFFDTSGLGPAARKAIEQGMKKGMDEIRHYTGEGFPLRDGWAVVSSPVTPGTDYLRRAATAYYALGEPLAQDAPLAFCRVDAQGRRLNGIERYVLRMEKDRLPLNHACWVLSVRESEALWNPEGGEKASLGSVDRLQAGPDGSIEIFIRKDPPGADRETNWLKAPEGDFTLMLRSYRPETQIPSGEDAYPQVKRMDE
jgi:hypothetical protein